MKDKKEFYKIAKKYGFYTLSDSISTIRVISSVLDGIELEQSQLPTALKHVGLSSNIQCKS